MLLLNLDGQTKNIMVFSALAEYSIVTIYDAYLNYLVLEVYKSFLRAKRVKHGAALSHLVYFLAFDFTRQR